MVDFLNLFFLNLDLSRPLIDLPFDFQNEIARFGLPSLIHGLYHNPEHSRFNRLRLLGFVECNHVRLCCRLFGGYKRGLDTLIPDSKPE